MHVPRPYFLFIFFFYLFYFLYCVSGCKCHWDIPAPPWLEALSISSLTRAQRSTLLSMNSSKVGLLLLLRVYVCISACAHMHMCVWAPVSVASDANQSWSLVTVLQQGDLRFDGADKHMMWLYISKVSTTCTHHAKSMSLLSLALSSSEKITVVLSCTCFDINRVIKTDANSFVVQLLSARLYYCSQERISIFIAILSIS